jgi:hypothetical protein
MTPLRHLLPFYLLLTVCLPAAQAQDCTTPPLPADFKARLAWRSSQDAVSNLATPVVANMNPQEDSIPEIIVGEGRNGSLNANKILFFRGDGSNFNSPMSLTIPARFDWYPVPGPTVGDVNGDGIPELLMPCLDGRIRVFNNYTENPVAPMNLWITSTGTTDFDDQRPYLADFDGDGIPEVYVGSDIFKFNFTSLSLNKIINGMPTMGMSQFSPGNERACNPTAVDILSVADCNGDPDCAGLELVAGPVIYSIDTDPSDGDGYEMKIKRNLSTMGSGNVTYSDGYTAVADVDIDGILDIIVTGRRANQPCVYVWNKNGLLRVMPYPQVVNTSGNLACVANVYDDTKNGAAQDFPEILVCSSLNFTCFNLNAAQNNPATPYWWNLPTSDDSGWTGATVYDFNGDNFAEIVYRDEEHLRILYGGSAPFPPGVDAERNWHKEACWSITADEYPVVADVDNDGETEITVTGRLSFNSINSRGRIHVYESDAGPWLPCRNVWNQYNYFVVNVNDDLSIPDQQQLHHLELPAAGSGNRPLNRYLSQLPLLNDNFSPFAPLPDAAISLQTLQCLGDSLIIQANVCNPGKIALPAGTPVAFYQTDPTTTNADLWGNIQFTSTTVEADSCVLFEFTIIRPDSTVFIVINNDGTIPRPFVLATDFATNTQQECDWLNNMTQAEPPPLAASIDLGPDRSACRDTLVTFEVPAGFSSYLWHDGSAGTTFQATQPGVYWVETTDYCAKKQVDTVQVLLLASPVVQLDTLQGDCQGNPASVTADVSGGFAPFQYVWSTGDNNPQLTDLSDGLYTVTVTNAVGCTAAQSIWVEAGGNLPSPIVCFGETGAIQLSFTAGQPPYNIDWSNGSDQQFLNDVAAGDYTVTVTDGDGCSQVLSVSLPQPAALLSNGIVITPACPGETNGTLQFNGASAGTPPYNLLWSNGVQTPGLPNLAPGNYQLTLTDAHGCAVVETATIPEFESPVTSVVVGAASCAGATDGQAVFQTSGGTPGFSYLWSTGATDSSIHQLSPGVYAATLTYANGACTQSFDFQIHEPQPILVSATANPAICNGGSGGNIDLTVQNGASPLAFSWSNNSTTEDLSNIPAGAYTVTVTDGNGCMEVYSQNVSESPAISLQTSVNHPLCADAATGSIQLTPGGGTSPFQFNWSNNATTATVSALASGEYTVTITDAAFCTTEQTIAVTAPLPLKNLGASTSFACIGASNGSATFLGASQGTPPYSIAWSTGATAPVITAPAGMYQYTVTDAHGCQVSAMVKIGNFIAPMIQSTESDASCFGKQDGQIQTTITLGSPGFEFLWSNNATTPDIAALNPGNYTLTITYADGFCQKVFDFQIEEPPALLLTDFFVTEARCFGEPSGSILLSTQGGVPPYQFQWLGGQQTEDLLQIGAGNYTLNLTDDTGCTMTASFVVPQPPPLTAAGVAVADTCEAITGAITTTTAGGTGLYQYVWSNGGQTSDLTGLTAGSYTLTLTDGNGCTVVTPVEIPTHGTIPQVTATDAVLTCTTPAATIGVQADQNGLQYLWAGPSGGLPDQATHLVATPGSYSVTVSNNFGCTTTAQLVVTADQAVPFVELGAATLDVFCDETLVQLDAGNSATGASFSHAWTGPGIVQVTGLVADITEPGLYIHTVANTVNGCRAADSVLVRWDAPIGAVLAIDSIRCFGDDNGIIRLTGVTGGSAPYHYTIDGQHFTNNGVFSGLLPGVYPVEIRDDFGCSWATTVTLTEPEEFTVSLTASDTLLTLGQWLQLTAQPSPADGLWQVIAWMPDTFEYQPLSLLQRVRPEDHTEFVVRMVDGNGCIAEDRLQVSVYNHHIYAPNVIYPGSDNNGGFTLFGSNGALEIKLLRVYDRWGSLLFERRSIPLSDPSLGWDGTSRNQPVSPGVFVWYAEVDMQDGQVVVLKGDVTVVR